MEIVEEVVIVGGGVAGLATAVALKRVGVRALVLERSDVPRTTGAALTLSENAWRALDALGVAGHLLSVYAPFQKGFITDVGSGQVQQMSFIRPDDKDTKFGSRTLHRRALLEALAQELPVDAIRFSSKLTAIDQIEEQEGGHIVIVHLEDGSVIKSKVLIGCDGVHSRVANWLGLPPPVHAGRSVVRGIAIYPQGHGFDRGAYQFVDKGKRAGFVPLNEKELFWFLGCLSPADKKLARDPELIKKHVLEDYAQNFPSSYREVVNHSELSSLTWVPLLWRYPWAIIFRKLSKGNVTVAGDAMHPMTPDLAQGACLAIEDSVILGRHIGNSVSKNGGRLVSLEVARVLDQYTKERRWRAAAIVSKAFVFGWVQQAGGNWWTKFLRDSIFYKYFAYILASEANFDCGKLPSISYGEESHQSSKRD